VLLLLLLTGLDKALDLIDGFSGAFMYTNDVGAGGCGVLLLAQQPHGRRG
jgi:hypothetical protein